MQPLDRYLREQVSQDARRRVAAPFVASTDGVNVLGFYTLSATSIRLTEIPVALAKKLPQCQPLLAALLGLLAIDLSARSVGPGRFLLIDAIMRVIHSEIASFALVLDAKDDTAASFYERESFIRLPGTPVRFLRRIDDIAALIAPA